MKAISIRNPWATDILNGIKIYEYRTWQTKHRGDLLICSSANPKIKGMLGGHALAVVNLADIIEITTDNYISFDLEEKPRPGEKLFAWYLTDLRAVKPFKVKGKLNFYEVDNNLIEYVNHAE